MISAHILDIRLMFDNFFQAEESYDALTDLMSVVDISIILVVCQPANPHTAISIIIHRV